MALGYLIVLGGSYLQGHFLTDPQGRPIANDFVNVWAAGRLALDGAAPIAYDWTLHRAAEVRAVGYDFEGYYGWHYPPPAFFFAAALATLPSVRSAGGMTLLPGAVATVLTIEPFWLARKNCTP